MHYQASILTIDGNVTRFLLEMVSNIISIHSQTSMSTIKLFECRSILARNRIKYHFTALSIVNVHNILLGMSFDTCLKPYLISYHCTLQRQCRQYIAWNVARYFLETVPNIISLHSTASMSTIKLFECRSILA